MKKPSNIHAVLIPDGEKPILLKILNCMSQSKNIRLYVMSTKKDMPLRYSRHIHRFLYFPEENSELAWIANINSVTEKYEIDVIMPIWETAIHTLIQHKNLLQNSEKLAPLPTLHDFTIASNKALLAEHLHAIGISGPNTVPLTLELIQGKDQLNLIFPLLAKPLKSGNGKGIVKFEDHETFTSYFKANGLHQSYILQEFIIGEDFCCNVLCLEGDILAFTIQKGNLWESTPFSAQMGMDFVHNDTLFQMAKKLMKSLNWTGVANIDLLFDVKNEVFHVLEINPRFWNSLTASLMAGVNFPNLLIQMALKKNIDPQPYKDITYVNLEGLTQYWKKDKALIFKTRFIWQSTPIKFRISDPIPIIFHFLQQGKNNFLQRIKSIFRKT